jgi:ABC-type molybdate transport system substrate-binding protein
MRRWWLSLLLLACVASARGADTTTVAAAADLTFALGEIAATYERDTGNRIRISFGSSGNLARQIPQGAPVDLFLAADEEDICRGRLAAQAARFALSGSAQGGIVAWSLVRSPELAKRGLAALIPESWHPPLRQRMALTRHAGEGAERFYDYLQQPAARAVFERYGFSLPAR